MVSIQLQLRFQSVLVKTYITLNRVQFHQNEDLVLALRLLTEAQLGSVAARHE